MWELAHSVSRRRNCNCSRKETSISPQNFGQASNTANALNILTMTRRCLRQTWLTWLRQQTRAKQLAVPTLCMQIFMHKVGPMLISCWLFCCRCSLATVWQRARFAQPLHHPAGLWQLSGCCSCCCDGAGI